MSLKHIFIVFFILDTILAVVFYTIGVINLVVAIWFALCPIIAYLMFLRMFKGVKK